MLQRTLRQIRERARRLLRPSLPPVSKHILNNQIQIPESSLEPVRKALEKHYHAGWRGKDKYSSDGYEADVAAHMHLRLGDDRRTIIPWLDHSTKLDQKRILEIGCGTGSSAVALAEQGAKVTGIDIDEGALEVAKVRAQVYGLQADFRLMNAAQMFSSTIDEPFDLVIFFASLEHMTMEERIASLRDAWTALPVGALLVIIETPNRLWYYDSHTSFLKFFHWLPDELALQYSRFSGRENFRELYMDDTPAQREHFLRRGRGMSFHELDVAIKSARELNVASSLSTFQGAAYTAMRSPRDRQYKSLLKSIEPTVHEGFFDEYLHLIIRKD